MSWDCRLVGRAEETLAYLSLKLVSVDIQLGLDFYLTSPNVYTYITLCSYPWPYSWEPYIGHYTRLDITHIAS